MSTTTTEPTAKPTAGGVTLTARAVAHVKTLFDRQGHADHALRIKVTGGGCSGLSYKLDHDAESKADDRIYDFDGLRVFVDLKSSLYLAGMTVDYSDDLLDAGFKFINPNATHSCGCGSSFSV